MRFLKGITVSCIHIFVLAFCASGERITKKSTDSESRDRDLFKKCGPSKIGSRSRKLQPFKVHNFFCQKKIVFRGGNELAL